jgi:hypothetical protein
MGPVVDLSVCKLALVLEAPCLASLLFRTASFWVGVVALAVIRGRVDIHPARQVWVLADLLAVEVRAGAAVGR